MTRVVTTLTTWNIWTEKTSRDRLFKQEVTVWIELLYKMVLQSC